jgi:hypothetical protein
MCGCESATPFHTSSSKMDSLSYTTQVLARTLVSKS